MRHGEVHNPEGVLYGRIPGYHLSERGHAMARRVADVLSGGDHDLRAVVASPLERAQQSARPTAEAFEVPLRSDPDLIEAGNSFEGLQINKNLAQLALPRYWPRYINPFTPSWGEPYTEIVARMSRAVRGCLDLIPDGGEVLAVSHQLPIWTLRRFLESKPLAHDPRHRECALASLTTLTFDRRRLVALTYWEPAADLVARASDMVPGTSNAETAGT